MALHPWQPQPAKPYLFTNANVVNPDDCSIRKASVLITKGIIHSIADTPDVDCPPETIKLDLTGKYLCPGLIDSHVHLSAVPGGAGLKDTFAMDHDRMILRQPWVCQQILRRGFTTVRDCGGATLALKDAISENVIQGPRVFIAGRALSQTGGHADLRDGYTSRPADECCGAIGRVCDGVDQCLHSARDELRQGADFIKIMAGGGVASPTDALDNVQFSAEEIRVICSVAAARKTYVTAHAYTPESIRQAIDNGVMGIEHGNLMDEATASVMAQKGVFLTPTLITYAEMGSEQWKGFLPPESAAKNQEVLRAGLRSLEIAGKAGVTMCYGTDLLGPLAAAQTREFGLRAQVQSPATLLQSATVNPARMLGQEKRLGQVQPGFVADLLMLDRNPLDDMTVFDHPDNHLLAVIKDGWVQVSRWSKLVPEINGQLPIIE